MISEGAAIAIVYVVLAVCMCVAGAAAFMTYKLQGAQQAENAGDKGQQGSVDFWYSARGSQGWVSLGLSFFASSMGAWVLFAAPEVGVYNGWWGTLGYALASALPFGFVAYLGPLIRRRFSDGFCLTDWVRQRFGRATQLYVAIISVFYMWVYLVAELISIGNLMVSTAGMDPLHALLPLSVFTLLYTTLAGLPASIWTDRLQGVIMIAFIVVAIIACFSDLSIASGKWENVATWSDKGFEALLTLVLAILGAELFNMGNWQRVYAAYDEAQLRKGCAFGAGLIFPTMMLFGIAGMLAEAQDQSRPVSTMTLKFLAFFDLLATQTSAIEGLVFALAVSMVASSVDSLQTGLVSVLSKDILQRDFTPKQTLAAGQVWLCLVNVTAIAVAWKGAKDPNVNTGVINLFLIADLLALSIAMPVFMGLGALVTQTGALAGCFSGLLVIMGFGWFEFGTFMAGLEMFTLMAFGNVMPAEVGLSASRTCILFFVLPVVTGAVAYVVSWMDHVSRSFSLDGSAAKEIDP